MDEQKPIETKETIETEKPEQTEQPNKSWLDEEAEQFTDDRDFEELPSLKLQPNEVTEIEIDFSEEFHKWQGEQGGKTIVKKIIPILFGGIRMNWWLNVKNPIYKEIIDLGRTGQKVFKILQTGTQANTKYVLVK